MTFEDQSLKNKTKVLLFSVSDPHSTLINLYFSIKKISWFPNRTRNYVTYIEFLD